MKVISLVSCTYALLLVTPVRDVSSLTGLTGIKVQVYCSQVAVVTAASL